MVLETAPIVLTGQTEVRLQVALFTYIMYFMLQFNQSQSQSQYGDWLKKIETLQCLLNRKKNIPANCGSAIICYVL